MSSPATNNPATNNSVPAHNRRQLRSHFVNLDVRLRLIVDDVLFALVAALAAIGILYVLSNREIGDSMYSAHISIKQTRELLNHGVVVAGVVTFAAVLIFGLWSLIDAHRIAGPMHRMLRLLKEIAEGDLRHEIRFRKRDEFQEIAAAADNLVDVYALRLGRLRTGIQAASKHLAGDTLNTNQIRDLREMLASLDAELVFFKIPEELHPEIDNSPIQ